MDLIKNILFFVVLTAILCAIILFEIRSERRRFFEPAPSSPRLHQSWTRARLAESARRRSPYLGARFAVEISRSERQSHKVGDIARLHLLDDSGPVVFGRS